MKLRPLKIPTLTLLIAFFAVFPIAGCGGGGGTTVASGSSSSSFGQGHSLVAHFVVIVLENQNYNTVVGSKAMPYLNSLAGQGAIATNYYADIHPSLPNYFMMTVGDLVTQVDTFQGVVSSDNVVREITGSGKTWKAYAQSLPGAGYMGPDVYPYAHHHNPFAYFSDVQQNSTQQLNIVPLTQLATDLASNSLPNYAMIIPDEVHNSHDCPGGLNTTCTDADRIAAADQFLQATVPGILSNAEFQQSGLLVITFDEAGGDQTNGGGKVATVLVGSHVRPGYQGSTLYQHESVERLSLEALGLQTFPGKGASAPSMIEFFQ